MSVSETLFGRIKSLDRARSDVDMARQRLANSLHDVQVHFSPSQLASEALGDVKSHSVDLAHHARATIRQHPIAAITSAASVGLLILARPLQTLIRRAGQRLTSRRTVAVAAAAAAGLSKPRGATRHR